MKNKLKIQLITICSLFGLWIILGYFNFFDKRIIPDFNDVFLELLKNILNGEILGQLFFSIFIILKGILISFILSLIFVFLGKLVENLGIVFETFSTIFNPLPGIAILPFIILGIGVNTNSVLIIIVHSILWPLYINFKNGVDSVSKILIDVSESLNMTNYEKFRHLYFPSSIGNIIAGLRIGFGRGWRALISAEMIFGAIGGNGGIGWYIFEKRVFMDAAGMFSGLIVIMLLGIFVENFIFQFFENKTVIKWGIEK